MNSPYKYFLDTKLHDWLQKQKYSYDIIYPHDDNAAFGIKNKETKAVICRGMNLVAVLNILDEINAGIKEGR